MRGDAEELERVVLVGHAERLIVGRALLAAGDVGRDGIVAGGAVQRCQARGTVVEGIVAGRQADVPVFGRLPEEAAVNAPMLLVVDAVAGERVLEVAVAGVEGAADAEAEGFAGDGAHEPEVGVVRVE